ncbi:hypothetical protein WA026_017923 [Henosepilachna vigintioctopunctata]|uniref:Peptidase A1 domain-containing protein n=1 Tax=Henosepilachna vigintioctopunctata TaxID=420089 RepID=A0AAW1TVR9_9CUCU
MAFQCRNMTPHVILFICIFLWDVQISLGQELNSIEHNHTMRITLHHQKPAWEQQMNSPLYKYGITAYNLHGKGGNRTNDSVVLYRFLDTEFYGKIVIGHPGQPMNVAFDTTWIYTWVMSSECNVHDPNATGCLGHNLYNHRKSSEYKPYNKKFNSGTLTGDYGFENISIAHSNVANFTFIEMKTVPDSFIFNKADGIMGLGLKANEYEPFFYTLVRQGKIKDQVFSIYINRNRQSYRQKGGELQLGFYDKKHIKVDYINGKKIMDEILYLPAGGTSYWQFKMDKVVMVFNPKKTEEYCQKGCNAIIDSSSSIITGPTKAINQINANIEAREIVLQNEKRFVVDCDTVNGLPKMEFHFQNKVFTFSGPKYIIKVSNKTVVLCMSAFQYGESTEKDETWTLGATFLAEVYTIYDVARKRIGLVRVA